MRAAALATVFVLIPGIAAGAPNSELVEIRKSLEATAAAASSEYLDTYVGFFDIPFQSQIRKTAALRFAQFDVEVSIEDCHVLSSSESSRDVAVRYSTHLSGRSYDSLSVLTLKPVDGTWRIRKETIYAWQESTVVEIPFPYGGSSCSTSSARSFCSSGSCSLSGM